jgi:hypothetical protein
VLETVARRLCLACRNHRWLAAIVEHAADTTPAIQFKNGLKAVLDGIEARTDLGKS